VIVTGERSQFAVWWRDAKSRLRSPCAFSGDASSFVIGDAVELSKKERENVCREEYTRKRDKGGNRIKKMI
jgi:hypothetical protein